MAPEAILLAGSAATIAFVHTILGPDHYLPFVAFARARRWSSARTAAITAACGLGHVASSVVLGLVGSAAGLTLRRLEIVEAARGEIAAWMLMAFGLSYAAWSLRHRFRSRRHDHVHAHADGVVHRHPHGHHGPHVHAHTDTAGRSASWVLFTIFLLGPCEPLIPLFLYPAAALGVGATVLVVAVFGIVTIATMLLLVLGSLRGLQLTPRISWLPNPHAVAGIVVFLAGAAIRAGL